MQVGDAMIRHRVTDLDAAVRFYEALTGQSAKRFGYSGADLTAVGPFLLFAADGEVGDRLARVVATIAVSDIETCAGRLRALGAEIIAPPAATPNGHRLIARHADGGVFEYTGP